MNKNYVFEETIAAISTPEGEGGIAVIRVSGCNSEKIINKIFRQKSGSNSFESRKIYYGDIVNPFN
ncbi:MAG: tRNA uridine-5-carboxymethylaminomethyl(34) synthesis GTPase MnmE, partial [Thermodesulfobacteriota bacterium]